MKLTTSILAFCAAFAAVSAQSVSDLPSCALTCFVSAIAASGCSTTDTVCQCTTGKDKITASATPCIEKACSPADASKTQTVSNAICAAALSSASSGGTTATTPAASGSASSTITITSASAAGSSGTSTASAAAQTSNAAADVRGSGVAGVCAAVVGLAAAVLAV